MSVRAGASFCVSLIFSECQVMWFKRDRRGVRFVPWNVQLSRQEPFIRSTPLMESESVVFMFENDVTELDREDFKRKQRYFQISYTQCPTKTPAKFLAVIYGTILSRKCYISNVAISTRRTATVQSRRSPPPLLKRWTRPFLVCIPTSWQVGLFSLFSVAVDDVDYLIGLVVLEPKCRRRIVGHAIFTLVLYAITNK